MSFRHIVLAFVVCLPIANKSFAQKPGRHADRIIYQSFLNAALFLDEHEQKLSPDPSRKLLLQKHFSDLELTDQEWQRIRAATEKAKPRIAKNKEEGMAFLLSVRKQYPVTGPVKIPADHQNKLDQLDRDRNEILVLLKQDLKIALGSSFQRFDEYMSDQASSKVQQVVAGQSLGGQR